MTRKQAGNRIAFLLLIASLFLVFSCPSDPDPGETQKGIDLNYVPKVPDSLSPLSSPETMSGNSAFDYFADNGIFVGWNLGNTLDAWNSVSSGEDVSWGNPKANQEIFDGVKAQGFDIVRIPITWMGHIGPGPDYHIDAPFLNRVAEVVGYAKNAGLVAIINLHHDGSTPSKTVDNGWLSVNAALKSAEGRNAVSFQYFRVWKQIAAYFKNQGDYLIFEAFNELHDGGWFWPGREGQLPIEQFNIINDWNQLFCDTVRSTGGNNDKRYLIIPGYCTGITAILSANFKLPKDSASGKLMAAFHYYRPDNFALNGSGTTWDTVGNKNEITNLFGQIKTKFTDKGIKVILGESGPVLNQNAAGDANRALYASYLYSAARNNGIVPVYWDNGATGRNGDGFGLLVRSGGSAGQPNSTVPGSAALINAMIDAAKN